MAICNKRAGERAGVIYKVLYGEALPECPASARKFSPFLTERLNFSLVLLYKRYIVYI